MKWNFKIGFHFCLPKPKRKTTPGINGSGTQKAGAAMQLHHRQIYNMIYSVDSSTTRPGAVAASGPSFDNVYGRCPLVQTLIQLRIVVRPWILASAICHRLSSARPILLRPFIASGRLSGRHRVPAHVTNLYVIRKILRARPDVHEINTIHLRDSGFGFIFYSVFSRALVYIT